MEPEAPPDRRLWCGLRAFFGHTAERPHGWAVLYEQARAQGEPFAAEVGRLGQAGAAGENGRELWK